MLKAGAMQKSKIFDFDLEIYNARVHIFHNVTDEEIQEYIQEKFPGAKYERSKNNSAVAFVLEHEKFGEQYAIDFIVPLALKNPESDKTIAHEASHVTWEICNSRAIHCDYENQEGFAYILGYIVKIINEEVFG